MPISEYKVVVGSNAKELESAIHAGGLTPIGNVDASFDGGYALQSAGIGTYDIGRVTDYELKQGKTIAELEEQVNECIRRGKQPVNGVLSWHDAFIQEMGVVEPISGGGDAPELPKGNAFEVLGFDANKDLKAMKSGMAQWLGEDRQIGGNAFDFVPTAYITGAGQRVSQGKPGLRAISNSPGAGSIAVRDSGGVLSGNAASRDVELTNLKQVREMIEASQGGGIVIHPTGAAYQIMGFSESGASAEPMQMSMDIWMGKKVTKAEPVECVPVTMFNTDGLLSQPEMRQLDALPLSSTIAFRDSFGRTGVAEAVDPHHAVNLQQLQAMLAAWRKDIEDNIVDVINGAIGK